MAKIDPFKVEIPDLIGKTVEKMWQDSGEFHSLDGGYDQDGPICIKFTDGTLLRITGYWCNDSTASIEFVISPPK